MRTFFKELLTKDSLTQNGAIYEWRNVDQQVHAYDYGENYAMPIALTKNLKDEGLERVDELTEDFVFEGFNLTMTVWRNKKEVCDWMCPLSMFVHGYWKGADERVLIEFRNSK